METDLQAIGKRLAAARNRVPFQNRRKYELEAEDFFDAIQEALHAGRADRAAVILAKWEDREYWLIHSPTCHIAPPCLVRRLNETTEQLNERRFKAWRKY